MNSPSRPIGIFDSGIGGLTVFRALREALPHEDFIYLGDTARLPFGTKSKEAVEHYTLRAAHLLRGEGIKFLVIACNTASSQALPALQRDLPDLPYCGVISAGAEAAVKATRNNHIAILATEGTVRSGAYSDIIYGLRPDAEVQAVASSLLVALAEEGWSEGPEAEAVIGRYLKLLVPGFDTLLLGCTHYPFLIPTLRKLCPPEVHIVDSASVTARAVAGLMEARGMANQQERLGHDTFYVTDLPERFSRVGRFFLGREIHDRVSQTDLPLLAVKEPVKVRA